MAEPSLSKELVVADFGQWEPPRGGRWRHPRLCRRVHLLARHPRSPGPAGWPTVFSRDRIRGTDFCSRFWRGQAATRRSGVGLALHILHVGAGHVSDGSPGTPSDSPNTD